ncbi:uncharacterized protein VTP21DRAFT_270 [Calcarisporiella thermophila]|uniref:uncharacterized protein n=1 Tax=Calcarisporiella thermophila TaxID=911321 RepID=UPI0037421AE7
MPPIDYRTKPTPRSNKIYTYEMVKNAEDNAGRQGIESRDVNRSSYISYALTAGLLAALASVFAKLFTDPRTEAAVQYLSEIVCNRTQCFTISLSYYEHSQQFDVVLLTARAACFAMMCACNAFMWTLFTKALNLSASSINVTVLNSTANFCSTALLGHLLFNEPLALKWWFGASLIITGTVMMTLDQPPSPQPQQKKES